MFIIGLALTLIQAKERLKECLQLMHTALSYFSQTPPTATTVIEAECTCQQCPSSIEDVSEHSEESLLRSASAVALSYITVAREQFNGFVSQASRQVRGLVQIPCGKVNVAMRRGS